MLFLELSPQTPSKLLLMCFGCISDFIKCFICVQLFQLCFCPVMDTSTHGKKIPCRFQTTCQCYFTKNGLLVVSTIY